MGRYMVTRPDNGSKALIKYAEDLGFVYCALGTTIDGVLAWGTTLTAVDWKSPGGTLTPAQAKLLAKGFPVRFISKPEQLDQLKAEMGTHG